MEIKVNLSKEDMEKLNRLTSSYGTSPSNLIKYWIITETYKLELEEYKEAKRNKPTQKDVIEYDIIKEYNEATQEDDIKEATQDYNSLYNDNPFGDSDNFDDEDLDDWDFN